VITVSKSNPVARGIAGRVHPVLIILCFLAGGTLFGVIGVITAVSGCARRQDDPVGALQRAVSRIT
jgi:hypothetical protein